MWHHAKIGSVWCDSMVDVATNSHSSIPSLEAVIAGIVKWWCLADDHSS